MQLWKRIRRKNNAQTKTTLSPPSATSPPITTSATSIHHPPPPSGLTGPNEEITRDAKVESTTRTEEPIKKQESIDGHPLVPPRNPHWSPFEKPSEAWVSQETPWQYEEDVKFTFNVVWVNVKDLEFKCELLYLPIRTATHTSHRDRVDATTSTTNNTSTPTNIEPLKR